MKNALKRSIIAVAISPAIVALSWGIASATSTSAPTVNDDGAYNSVVHVCVSLTNESHTYVEEHTNPGTIGNCAAGYEQAEINVPYLAPAFNMVHFPAVSSATPSPSPTSTQSCSLVMSTGANGSDPNQIIGINCYGG